MEDITITINQLLQETETMLLNLLDKKIKAQTSFMQAKTNFNRKMNDLQKLCDRQIKEEEQKYQKFIEGKK